MVGELYKVPCPKGLGETVFFFFLGVKIEREFTYIIMSRCVCTKRKMAVAEIADKVGILSRWLCGYIVNDLREKW